jgi:hypothetical protein
MKHVGAIGYIGRWMSLIIKDAPRPIAAEEEVQHE